MNTSWKTARKNQPDLKLVDPEGSILNHNADAEVQVLAAIVDRDDGIEIAANSGLMPLHFYNMHNAKIYETMIEMNEKGWKLDYSKLTEILNGKGYLEAIGENCFRDILLSQVRENSDIGGNAKIIIEAYKLRLLRTVNMQNEAAAAAPESRLFDEIYRDALERMIEVGIQAESSNLERLDAMIKNRMHDINLYYSGMLEERIYPTGISSIDILINGGLMPKSLTLIGAYTSAGKSAICLDILMNLANAGHRGIFYSLELDKDMLASRLLARESGVNLKRVLRPSFLNNYEKEQLDRAQTTIDQVSRQIYVDYNSTADNAYIHRNTRALMKKDPAIGFVIVDYLQIISPMKTRKYHSRENEVSQSAKALRETAKELGVMMLVPCQVNDEVCTRDKTELYLHDIRESKAAAKHGDVVMMLYYRDMDQWKLRPSRPIMELKVAKSNRGPTGKGWVIYDMACQRFEDHINMDDYEDIKTEDDSKRNDGDDNEDLPF